MTTRWWQAPLRIVQVNLQVVDTPLLDPDEVMRQLREELHANAVVFNAGGIYAFYPTQVPHHFPNPYLEGRDLLGESVEAAHRHGLKYIARVDFSKADDSIFHQRPEWFAKTPEGQPLAVGEPRYGPWSLLYATCTNGGYCGEDVAHPVMEEILSYDVDGLFYNGASYRVCHCGECRRRYREAYGEELPDDPGQFRDDWAQRSFVGNMQAIHRVCHALRPDVPWLGHYWLPDRMMHSVLRSHGLRLPAALGTYADVPCSEPADILNAGYLEKRPSWYSGMTARLGRAVLGGVPPIVIIHACTGMSWRHTTLPEHEYRYWLSQVVAHGGNLWHTLTGIPNTQYDRRILDVVGSFNALLERHEALLADTELVAPVAVVFSAQSIRETGPEEFLGTIEALLNHQIPFAFLLAEHLTDKGLAGFDTCVLPSVRLLSDEATAALQRFAARGGGLVASFETGLCDECGGVRPAPALADLFGVQCAGHYLRGQSSSYMRVEDPEHPLLAGIGPTQHIANQLDLLQVTGAHPAPLTLVPPFATPQAAGSPPERASIPTQRTGIPLAVCGERSVYFAGEIGRLVWKYRLSDHQDLLANAVRLVTPRRMPVEVEGPHSLQVSLYRRGEDLLVHLVNGTGDRPLQDTIPLHDVRLRLCVPNGPVGARAVFSGQSLDAAVVGEVASITVPRIDTWEIVHVTPT